MMNLAAGLTAEIRELPGLGKARRNQTLGPEAKLRSDGKAKRRDGEQFRTFEQSRQRRDRLAPEAPG